MSSPLVSVVVPVYNAMPYLEECLTSIREQTLKDIEIICIDDGSTDGSREVLQKHAASDDRIIVLEGARPGSNGGTSRNLGLDDAKGDYVIFLDADDFFELDMLELAYGSAIENDSDIVLFNGDKFNQHTQDKVSGYEVLRSRFVPNKAAFSPHDISEHIFQITSPSPWSQLYKRSYLASEGIRFQSLPNTNDAFMTFTALALATRISVVNKALVHYRINTHSSIQDGKWRDPLCFLEAFSAIESKLIDNGIYEDFKDSFMEAALVHVRFNLNTQRNHEARMSILDSIEEDRFFQFDLLTDESETLSKKAKAIQESLRAAIRQRAVFSETKNLAAIDIAASKATEAQPLLSLIVVESESASDRERCLEILESAARPEIETVLVTSRRETGNEDDPAERLSAFSKCHSICHVGSEDTSTLMNIGMDAARGKYLLMLDAASTTVLDAEYLGTCMQTLKEADSRDGEIDIMWIGPNAVSVAKSSKGKSSTCAHQLCPDKPYSGKEVLKALYFGGSYDSNPRNFIYRKGLASHHSAVFQNGLKHSDISFAFRLFTFAETCIVAPIPERSSNELERSFNFEPDFNDAFGYSNAAHLCERLLEDTHSVWRPQELDAALRLIREVLDKAVSAYMKMPKSERGARLALSPIQEAIYRQNVVTPANKEACEKKLERALEQIQSLKHKAPDAHKKPKSTEHAIQGRKKGRKSTKLLKLGKRMFGKS